MQRKREPASAVAVLARRHEHQRHDLARAVKRVDERVGRDHDGAAVLVFKLDQAVAAVPRQMQHVIVVPSQGGGDAGDVGNLENAHPRAVIPDGLADRIQDRPHLRLDIQRSARRLTLVRRTDGDEDPQRARSGRRRPPLAAQLCAREPHRRVQRRRLTVGEPSALKRQRHQIRRRANTQIDHAARIQALQQASQRRVDLARKHDGCHPSPQLGQDLVGCHTIKRQLGQATGGRHGQDARASDRHRCDERPLGGVLDRDVDPDRRGAQRVTTPRLAIDPAQRVADRVEVLHRAARKLAQPRRQAHGIDVANHDGDHADAVLDLAQRQGRVLVKRPRPVKPRR